MARPIEQTLKNAIFMLWEGTDANIGILTTINKILFQLPKLLNKENENSKKHADFINTLVKINQEYITIHNGVTLFKLSSTFQCFFHLNELNVLGNAIESYKKFLSTAEPEWASHFKWRYLRVLNNYVLDAKRDLICEKLSEIKTHLAKSLIDNIKRLADTGKDDMIVEEIMKKFIALRFFDFNAMDSWLRDAFGTGNQLTPMLTSPRFFSETCRTMDQGYCALATDRLRDNHSGQCKAYDEFIKIYDNLPFNKFKLNIAKAIINLFTENPTLCEDEFIEKLQENNPLTQALKNQCFTPWSLCCLDSTWSHIEEEVLTPKTYISSFL